MKIIPVFLLCFITIALYGQEDYIAVQNQTKFGFINLRGDTILPFQYKNVGLFSEGLVPVREKGYFGFVDTTGRYILPAIYDYAESFQKGYAKVWINGICYLINKKGKALFSGEYIDFDWDRIEDTIGVKTITNRTGAVDIDGRILLDTIAQYVDEYYESGSSEESKYFGAKYLKTRENGKIGIATKDRKYVISPNYESIEFVTDSLVLVSTKVYQNIFIIDLSEKILLDTIFRRIYDVSDFALEVETKKSNKHGLLNLELEYVFDTIYRDISYLGNQYFELENTHKEKGLFHFNGDTIVPFGQYHGFGGGGTDYLIVDFLEEYGKDTLAFGVINKEGELVKEWYLMEFEGRYLDFDKFSIEDEKYIMVERKSNKKRFKFDIITGDTIPKIYKGLDYYAKQNERRRKKRVHLLEKDLTYHLVNWKGDLVTEQLFQDYNVDDFYSRIYGNFIVAPLSNNKEQKTWGVIDSFGKIQIEPIYTEIERVSEEKGLFEITNAAGKKGVYSITKEKILIPLDDYTAFRVVDGLIVGRDDSLLFLFNREGKRIWTEYLVSEESSPDHVLVQNLDIDFQHKCWYAVEEGDFSKERKGVMGDALTQYAPTFESNIDFPTNQFSIVIDTTQLDTVQQRYFAYPMYLVNLSADTLVFASQDGRLYLKMQALDKNGIWKDIDHLTNSWCGNSYGYNWLQPNGLWQFSIPVYDGVIKTRLRMALITSKAQIYSKSGRGYGYSLLREDSREWIYSESFVGYINPAQFWRKLDAQRFSLYR